MFAVIKTGGKQYRVAADDVITIAKLEAEPGAAVTFDHVLTLTGENGTEFGAPGLEGVTVSAEVLRQERGDKVIAFKKRRRQNSRRKRGHRQHHTVVRITDLLRGGSALPKAAKTTATKPEKNSAAEAEPALTEQVTVE